MSKRVRHDLVYEAPASEVLAMLHDASFREEVCDATGVIRHNVTVTENGAATEVRIEQVQTAQGIPSFAKKFVGDEIEIVQNETWTDDTHADVEVTIPGKPGHMRGTATLVESGGTTTEQVDLEIKVNIPLVGGKIEGLIADMLLRALKVENTTGQDYLSR
jgi:hypothetical protein